MFSRLDSILRIARVGTGGVVLRSSANAVWHGLVTLLGRVVLNMSRVRLNPTVLFPNLLSIPNTRLVACTRTLAVIILVGPLLTCPFRFKVACLVHFSGRSVTCVAWVMVCPGTVASLLVTF